MRMFVYISILIIKIFCHFNHLYKYIRNDIIYYLKVVLSEKLINKYLLDEQIYSIHSVPIFYNIIKPKVSLSVCLSV